MTQDIIEMPEYLNASYEGDDLYTGDQVRELMKLVATDAAAKEREACAKLCDDRVTAYRYATDSWAQEHIDEARHLATAIRARGQE